MICRNLHQHCQHALKSSYFNDMESIRDNDETKYIVSGYLRNIEQIFKRKNNNNPYYNSSGLILYLCSMYFVYGVFEFEDIDINKTTLRALILDEIM